MKRFYLVWTGQTVSAIGSEVSGIGTAVYVFLETGSAVWLGLLTALATLPPVLAAPFMTIVDRVPRRTMMMLGDAFAALTPALLLPLAIAGRLEIWQLAVGALVSGTGSAFQSPAAQAAVPLLVPPDALGRANSLVQLGPAVGIVLGPVLAAPLVAWWGITVVLIVDLVTFAVAVATIALVRFDEPLRTPGEQPAGAGWRPALDWLAGPGRPLSTLLCAGALVNAALALFNVGVLTLATEIGGAGRAGLPIGAIGLALVVGSVAAGVRGVSHDRVRTFAIGLGAMSLGCVVVAAYPNLIAVIAGGMIAVALVPAVNAASATLFHERVPADIQGRVFALRSALSGALFPAASALAGVSIARVGAPLMDGPLAGSLGGVIGSGPERGAALVILAAGAGLGALAIWLARSPLRTTLAATPAPVVEPVPMSA